MKLGGHFLIGYLPMTCIHYAYCVSSWQLPREINMDINVDDFLYKSEQAFTKF